MSAQVNGLELEQNLLPDQRPDYEQSPQKEAHRHDLSTFQADYADQIPLSHAQMTAAYESQHLRLPRGNEANSTPPQ